MAEGVNREAIQALKNRASEGPVTMLNLLKFKPGGWESYARYAAATAPLLEKAGGGVVDLGKGAELVIGGDDDWDLVMLVRYPSRAAFLGMIGSDAYQAIVHLRTEAVSRSVLLALDPFRFSGDDRSQQ